MKQCKSCKAEIPNDAKKCSHCGSSQRGFIAKHPVFTTIIGLLLVVIILVAISSGNKGNNSASGADNSTANAGSSNQASPQASPNKIEIAALFNEYDSNKLAADDKYKGQLLETTGKIENISQDITGSYYVSLDALDADNYSGESSIECYADKSQLTSLTNGQNVTVMGTDDGQDLGIISFKNCQIVK